MRNEEDKAYLANKHKGGEANAKGGLYEDFYAVFQIVSCIAHYKATLDGVALQTQLEDTFVDDLLIADASQRLRPDGTPLTEYQVFENQIKDCHERNEQFALKLIYSSSSSLVGEKIPDSIKAYTTVEYFPYQEDLNGLIIISEAFQDALRIISVMGNESTVDELVNNAMVFLGVWKACGCKHRVRLSDIVSRAEDTKHFNLAIFSDETLSESCREILDGIEGLSYSVIGRMFYWQMGNFTGSCPWPEGKEQEIINKKPTTRRELVAIL